DIFSVNAVAYVPPDPGGWTPPVSDLVPFSQQRLVEAPAFGAEDMSRRYVITMGVPSSNGVIAYDVWTDASGGGTDFQQTNSI
ncbi:UNVERIFIED_CONTAM: hypothetical protein IGO34_34510, partial [Salmonella enterica subsp. enterica serovar Weltevreden]